MPVTALLGAIQLAQGRASDAMVTSREAIAGYDQIGEFGFKGCFARLVHARALHAMGDGEGARMAIRATRDRVLAKAATISDPEIRRTFLAAVPENAQALELAQHWLGEATDALLASMVRNPRWARRPRPVGSGCSPVTIGSGAIGVIRASGKMVTVAFTATVTETRPRLRQTTVAAVT